MSSFDNTPEKDIALIGVGLSATSQPQTKSFGGPGLVGYSLSKAILGLQWKYTKFWVCNLSSMKALNSLELKTNSLSHLRTHSKMPVEGFFFTAEDCFVELVFGLNMVILQR